MQNRGMISRLDVVTVTLTLSFIRSGWAADNGVARLPPMGWRFVSSLTLFRQVYPASLDLSVYFLTVRT